MQVKRQYIDGQNAKLLSHLQACASDSLCFESSVEVVPGPHAGKMVAVPPQVAECSSQAKGGAEVQHKASTEHPGNRRDSH